mmetsp:Transcript_35574/g.80711  ORF Transcript_35574/g.80711 Transcript_35574/m.80711 type:complete len:270 (+) Transcript_35574:260-1069(+)
MRLWPSRRALETALLHHPRGHHCDVIDLAALEDEARLLQRAVLEGHVRGGVQAVRARQQGELRGQPAGIREAPVGAGRQALDRLQNLVFVEVVAEAVRIQKQEVSGAHRDAVALAILGRVWLLPPRKPLLQRRGHPQELEREVPPVLLLSGPGHNPKATGRGATLDEARVDTAEQHEPRVAQAGHSQAGAVEVGDGDRGRTVGAGPALCCGDGCQGPRVWLHPRSGAGCVATAVKIRRRQCHELLRVVRRRAPVGREVADAAHAVGDSR